MKKLFKYIDGILNGYTPVSAGEAASLMQDNWVEDANVAYLHRDSNPPVDSDENFRAAANAAINKSYAQVQAVNEKYKND